MVSRLLYLRNVGLARYITQAARGHAPRLFVARNGLKFVFSNRIFASLIKQ